MIVCEDKTFTDKYGKERKGFYMDDYLVSNLKILKKAVDNNWDGIILIDGIEGSAKSTIASSISYYLSYLSNRHYDIKNVVFTQEEFFKAVDEAKPYEVIHWDEFIFGGLSTEALNKVQNALIKKVTTIRKKRLFIILVMPWFFMIRKYFAIGRSRCLIHTYTTDGITRGRFMFFSYTKKQKLYLIGKKEYKYCVSPDFIGKFTNTFGYFWDEEAYDTKKEKAIDSLNKKGENTEEFKKKDVIQHLLLTRCKVCSNPFSMGDIAKMTNTSKSYVHDVNKGLQL